MPCLPLRIEATGLDTLDLMSDELSVALLDLGDPIIREVTIDAPGSDGTIDSSRHIGARVVTMEVLIRAATSDESRWTLSQRLKAFTHPRLRPQLFVQFPGGDELFVTLRRSQFADIWTPESLRRERATVTLQWVAPYGILESSELHSATVGASGSGSAGITFPVEFPITFPDATPEGSVLVTNAGTADAYALFRLYGPFSGETLVRNDETGQALVIDGETVTAGNFLEIDSRTKTIRLNGDPDQSRYHRLVYPDSEWFTLAPGVQRLAFIPETFTAPAQMDVIWRDAWL